MPDHLHPPINVGRLKLMSADAGERLAAFIRERAPQPGDPKRQPFDFSGIYDTTRTGVKAFAEALMKDKEPEFTIGFVLLGASAEFTKAFKRELHEVIQAKLAERLKRTGRLGL